ncbi:MAG: hypothetical protein DI537_51155 [Stutzerimonas stutzeri]|nr:MAG: hypothetical protein DI537_51155 [Stutzerimonas stutzeri]
MPFFPDVLAKQHRHALKDAGARDRAGRIVSIRLDGPAFVLRAFHGAIIQQVGHTLKRVDTQHDAMSFGVHSGSRSCASRHTAGAEVNQLRNPA